MTKKRPRKTRRAPRKLNKRNLITLILAILVFFELAGTATGLIMVGSMLRDKPELEVDDFFSAESSHIFDKDGNQIADIGTQLRENITYNEMSEAVIDCFLAVEDSRYFKHDGFDMPRFIKAALVNVKNILTHNNSREGGSTFTMQLVKVTYFQNDETGETRSKDIEYKVEQIALARELERRSNKKAIFEMYLNKLNFGGTGNIRGIEMASQYYYGKHAGELNLAEAAMLAGVINSPYWYDPHNYLDYATRRRNTVLYQLMNHGYITKNEYNLAMAVKVEDTLIDPMSQRAGGRAYAYQSYIDGRVPLAARPNRAARLPGAVGNLVEEERNLVFRHRARDLDDVLGVRLGAAHGAEVVARQSHLGDLAVLPDVERTPGDALELDRLAREGAVDDVVDEGGAHAVLEQIARRAQGARTRRVVGEASGIGDHRHPERLGGRAVELPLHPLRKAPDDLAGARSRGIDDLHVAE